MIEILLVDDNPDVRPLMVSLLKSNSVNDVNLSSVHTLKAAKSFLKQNQMDLIILDLGLEESQGIDTFNTMYAIAAEVPIVIVTGSDESLAMEAIRLGAYEYLQKGNLNANMFERVIRQSLERHQLRKKTFFYAQKIEENEKRLSQIINHNVDGILIIDANGKIQFSNPSATKLLNGKSQKIIGREFGFPLVTDESTELDIPGNPVRNIEMRVVETTWKGEKAFLASLRDITDRKQAETELRKSEEKFHAIASSATDAIVHIDQQGEILFWNAAAENMFGYTAGEVYGKNLHAMVAPKKFKKKIQNGFNVFSKSGQGSVVGKIVELEAIKKNGKKFPVEVTFSSFQLDGQWHAAGNIRDITERKKSRENLLKTQKNLKKALDQVKSNQKNLIELESLKSIKELSGAVSHEFSQPLQALQTYLELIEKMGPQPKYVDKCRKLIKRISGLMHELNRIHTIKRKDYLNTKIIDLKASSVEKQHSEKPLILVVDDEIDVLEPIVEYFNQTGFECHGANNGLMALEMLNKWNFELILSDINMPEMSGPQLFEKIRDNGFSSYFIFLTGYEIPGEKRDIIMQADALINKPVQFKELIKIVNKLLGKQENINKQYATVGN